MLSDKLSPETTLAIGVVPSGTMLSAVLPLWKVKLLPKVYAAVSVLFSLASTWIETFGIVLYSRKGADALAKYSGVSQLVSYVRQGCGVPAAALFYLACGRYTVKAGD